MTFEEARAQFPVLERYAYLNAGTNGPLARATVDAMVEQTRRDLEHGRSGKAWFERILELREEARRGFAAVLGVDPLHVALTESTTRGCSIVLSGLGLGRGGRGRHDRPGAFRPHRAVHATGARVVVVEADEDAILAAVTPRTRLIAMSHVLWTTGRRLDLRACSDESGVPVLVDGAQSAGAIAVDGGEFDFYTVSAQKWLCAPEPTGALFVRDPERCGSRCRPTSRRRRTSGRARSSPKDGRRASTPAGSRADARRARSPRSPRIRSGATSGRREMAARCRELLDAARRGRDAARALDARVVPPGRRCGRARRARSHERGVIVRELPGRNLVRASCGWWTSEDDLQRLVAGVCRCGSPSSAAIGCSAATTVRMWSSSSTPSSSAPL